jgi:hypothetical protein
VERLTFIALAASFMVCGPRLIAEGDAKVAARSRTLLSAPLELGGEWGQSPEHSVHAILSRMREACLGGIGLVSDRQPQMLRVDDHSSGPPHVWLHEENPDTAWIVVDIAARHWAQLAYQFGHELGHVLCNSWLPQAKLEPPSRWLEEAMVEAFSMRGLGVLADSWEHDPPFPHDGGYARALRKYRQDLIEKYRKNGDGEPVANVAAWFRANRATLDRAHGVGKVEGPAIVAILGHLERDPRCVADMGAVNRWPALSAAPVEEYLRLWRRSCAEVNAPGILPRRLQEVLGVV